ncbi:MAG TPA: ribosomal L7Ae/L30e/S12e/Gadd45 family protein [bacterium]|nr:ribosomal L7Ae/L30e/S12e/Gadd45 family protein [bacterium]
MERLKAAAQRAVGTNQTAKAISRGQARVVFVALDADRRVTEPLLRSARERGVEVVQVPSMAALGRACGIAVGAAAAAILEASEGTRPEGAR